MSNQSDWPPYSLKEVHSHVFAIGVLSANFNELENTLLRFLQTYDGSPEEVVAFLFEKVPTETKLDWLLRLSRLKLAASPRIQERVAAFAKAYKTCAENRNLIIHSSMVMYFIDDDRLLVAKRAKKHGGLRTHDLTLATIRRVADEVHGWSSFGRHVVAYVLAQRRKAAQRRHRRSGGQIFGPTTLPEQLSQPVALVKPAGKNPS